MVESSGVRYGLGCGGKDDAAKVPPVLEGATDTLETKTVSDVAPNALDTVALDELKTTVLKISVEAALLAGTRAAVVYPAMGTTQKTALKSR